MPQGAKLIRPSDAPVTPPAELRGCFAPAMHLAEPKAWQWWRDWATEEVFVVCRWCEPERRERAAKQRQEKRNRNRSLRDPRLNGLG